MVRLSWHVIVARLVGSICPANQRKVARRDGWRSIEFSASNCFIRLKVMIGTMYFAEVRQNGEDWDDW